MPDPLKWVPPNLDKNSSFSENLAKCSDGWCCFERFSIKSFVLTRTKEEKHGGGKRGLLHTALAVSVSLVHSHVSKHVQNCSLKSSHFSVFKTKQSSELITKTSSVKVCAPSEVEHVEITCKCHKYVS